MILIMNQTNQLSDKQRFQQYNQVYKILLATHLVEQNLMKKNTKRQLDSNSEEVHESDTYCPSVERALFKECKLQELLAQNQLKKAGIQTAQTLIKVLYEEIISLKGQKQSLQTQITVIIRQFSQKEECLKTQITLLEKELKQITDIQLLKAAEMCDINSRSSLSKCFLPSSSRKISLPKSFKSIEKKTQQKSHYHESPIKKMSFYETVSKQYLEEQDMGSKICQDAVATLLSGDFQKLAVNFEEITDLIKDQNDQLMQYANIHEQNQIKVQQLSKELKSPFKEQLNYYQDTQLNLKYKSGLKSRYKKEIIRGKKLFSTQKSNQASPERRKFLSSWEDKIKQDSKGDISMRSVIKEYEDIIQQYKEYSAYLRAYLCSCISFISKSTEKMAENNTLYCLDSERLKNSEESECLSTDRSNNLVNFPSNRVFEVILRDILATVEDKVGMEHEIRRELQEQNKQLRQILDELVENLKRSGIKTNNTNRQFKNKMAYDMRQPEQSKNIQVQRDEQIYQRQSDSINKRDLKQQKSIHHYKKLNPPHLHRITLTQYKRYNNSEE